MTIRIFLSNFCLFLFAYPSLASDLRNYQRVVVSIAIDESSAVAIAARYMLSNTNHEHQLKYISLQFPRQGIDHMAAEYDAEPVEITLETRGASRILTATLPDRQITQPATTPVLTLRYSLSLSENNRIPFFTPLIPDRDPTADVPADITISVPERFSVGTDAFPRLIRKNGDYTASLPSLPGLLYIPIRKSAALTFWDPLFTVSGLTNVTFFSLIFAASIYWLVLRRRVLREVSLKKDR